MNAIALQVDSRHQAAIRRSHNRCSLGGLHPQLRPEHDPGRKSELDIVLDRSFRLCQHAAPIMELLYEQIVHTHSMVVLTDPLGTVLQTRGEDGFLERAQKVALLPGVSWAEGTKGTNAVGTAIIEEEATLVHASEHYLQVNQFLTCTAAPIFDPRGKLLGVLDVTGDERSYHQHTMGMVKMSARLIENTFFADNFRDCLRLHFHNRPEYLGTLLEGIVAITQDGRIVGANHSAVQQIGMSVASLKMHSLVAIFGTTLGSIVDYFRAPLVMPMKLTLPNGVPVRAQAEFSWSTLHSVAQPVAQRPASPFGAGDPSSSGLSSLCLGDPNIKRVVEKLHRARDHALPILIAGPTGSGKEVMARAIHASSKRASRPFVVLNGLSIPDGAIDTALFGSVESTGSNGRREAHHGLLLQATGGTLFVDDICALSPLLQQKLLAALQDRAVTPVGAHQPVGIDCHLICATREFAIGRQNKSGVRDDLYFRLSGLVVTLPSLAERLDFEPLVARMLAEQCGGSTPEVTPEAMLALRSFGWPGNLRQLHHVLSASAAVRSEPGRIALADLPDFLQAGPVAAGDQPLPRTIPGNRPSPGGPVTYDVAGSASVIQDAARVPLAVHAAGVDRGDLNVTTLELAELAMIRQAVAMAGGNISEAAKRLGISRNTIYRKLRSPA